MNKLHCSSIVRRMLIPFILLLVACEDSGPRELVQAADAIGAMLKPLNHARSMFTVAFPDGLPSQYVSYLFSGMGSAEWPPSEAWADEITREQMETIRQPLLPGDVEIVPRYPDQNLGKQLVISFDDERGVVIAQGFLDPAAEPQITREWKLPDVQPAVGIQEIYQANLEMGISPVSFPVP